MMDGWIFFGGGEKWMEYGWKVQMERTEPKPKKDREPSFNHPVFDEYDETANEATNRWEVFAD